MNTDDVKAKQRGKEGVSKTLEKVQFSTASMGKFDKMRDGEKERKLTGKRNKFLPLTGAEKTEKERSMNVLKHVLGREENAGKNKGKSHDDDDEEVGGKRKKVCAFAYIESLCGCVELGLRLTYCISVDSQLCSVEVRSSRTSPRATQRRREAESKALYTRQSALAVLCERQ